MNPTTTSTGQSETRIGRHPLIWYFALAYAISWPMWLLSHLAGGPLGIVFIVIGGFGPMLAAAIIISRTGGSLSEWLHSMLRWRVSVGYYAYALGLPVLLAVMLNLTLAALGKQPDVSLVVERIPAYLQTLLLTAVIFGGQEEPGWRGFALPRLQQRHAPLIATLILGLGWGIWHVPLYGPAGFVVPLVLAFYYTWLYNKTKSVLLCILLHASFTPAQDHLLLTADSPLVDAVLLATYLVGAGILIALTRGRLGYGATKSDADSDQRSSGVG
ncbi:MAG TPA: type II CAAX endopeptidase family protein [Propionibacteriaceae bacterium]|nr:type II CAAX endopeptidase family protein [Propionibacteriaceae bacterium]